MADRLKAELFEISFTLIFYLKIEHKCSETELKRKYEYFKCQKCFPDHGYLEQLY